MGVTITFLPVFFSIFCLNHLLCRWLTPIILATQEAEIRRISVWSHPSKIVRETLFLKNLSQKRAGVAQGVALNSDPNTTHTHTHTHTHTQITCYVCKLVTFLLLRNTIFKCCLALDRYQEEAALYFCGEIFFFLILISNPCFFFFLNKDLGEFEKLSKTSMTWQE
jgi:hypothetical protein